MSRRAEIRRLAGQGYWREADGRAAVAAWQASGETIAAFARHHGINRQRLARWRSRLEPAAVQFHAVRLAGSGGVGGCDTRRETGTIEIALGGGQRVRVGPGFDAEDLRRVMAVIEETRC